ncbi:MAG: 4Fe-4S binding protein [Proteobacteria bacterium]|nr:4Fe-4S binding protein [Pseudomonadota bacterium]
MKHVALSLKNKVVKARHYDKTYKKLRKHLDTMPVGLPATLSGVERRILKAMFSVDEARLALYMDWRFETAETIFNKAGGPLSMTREEVDNLLSAMDKQGSIYAKNGDGVWKYALHPLVIGMFEFQVTTLTPALWLDMRKYFVPTLSIEYLTSAIPQLRVIPVEKSITTEHAIASYDEIRHIIEHTDKDICIAECICRKAHRMTGEPCKATDRKEFCLGFGDFGAAYTRNGWGRSITKEEAFKHLDLCEKEGCVIQPFNEKNPDGICFCCGCCCGVIEALSSFPRPADFVASNFYAALDEESCNGCGKCLKRCQMNAIELKDKKAVLNLGKCIGCGLCVTTCKTGSLKLVKKDTETVPPDTMEEKYEIIMDGKKGTVGKLMSAAKGAFGLKP